MSVKFEDIIGEEGLKQKLRDAVKNRRLAHTLLFSSADGSSALPMALALAQFVHCTNKVVDDACGSCPSCKQWSGYAHPDVHFSYPFAKQETAPKVANSADLADEWRQFLVENTYRTSYSWIQNNSADKKKLLIPKQEADAMFNSIKYKSYLGGYKIGIIWQPEKLHPTASNFLLKMLEEPRDNTLYILVSAKVNDILPTIISRVQHYRFVGNSREEVQQALINKFAISASVAESAASLANGSVGLAKEYADSLDGKTSFYEDFVAWMRLCFAKDLEGIQSFVEIQAQSGREVIKNFLIFCLEQIRKCLWLNSNAYTFESLPQKEQAFFNKFSPFVKLNLLSNYHNTFNNAIGDVLWNGNAKIILTDLSFKIMVLLKNKE